jgi:hypothetical protein
MLWELHFGQFDALSGHLRGGANKSHTKPSSVQPVCRPKFETGTSEIRSQNADGYVRVLLQLEWSEKGSEMKWK